MMTRIGNELARSSRNYRRYRATVWELNGMSDRELVDIGVARCDIARLAREAIR